MRRFAEKILLVAFVCLFACLGFARPARADSPIVLDGHFEDWQGQMMVGDRAGDSHSAAGDLLGFYWANNPDDNTCYWMIERAPSRQNVSYIVYFDADNNGRFRDRADRAIIVKYRPKKNSGLVSIEVREADNWRLIDRINNRDWGQSLAEGAAKVEFGVSFKDLGLMKLGQTVRMYAESFGPGATVPSPKGPESDRADSGNVTQGGAASQSFTPAGSITPDGESEITADLEDNQRLPWPDDRIPDSGDVQWSPVPVLGYPLLAFVVVGGVVALWYFKGRHAWRSR